MNTFYDYKSVPIGANLPETPLWNTERSNVISGFRACGNMTHEGIMREDITVKEVLNADEDTVVVGQFQVFHNSDPEVVVAEITFSKKGDSYVYSVTQFVELENDDLLVNFAITMVL